MNAIAKQFELVNTLDLAPRGNIAPTQDVAVIRLDEEGERRLAMLRWGLIPSWAADAGVGARMINARAETVDSKPSFRAAFKRRRCLIVADGFYEWRRAGGGKQPYLFQLPTGEPFAFAGVWERWRKGNQEIDSCSLLTTTPNDLVRPIHDRMPVILSPEHYAVWLDPDIESAEPLRPLLGPFAGELTAAALAEGPRGA